MAIKLPQNCIMPSRNLTLVYLVHPTLQFVSYPLLQMITQVIHPNLGNRIWPSLAQHFITQVMIYNLGYDLSITRGRNQKQMAHGWPALIEKYNRPDPPLLYRISGQKSISSPITLNSKLLHLKPITIKTMQHI